MSVYLQTQTHNSNNANLLLLHFLSLCPHARSFCISLVFAGALGNIIDSAVYGVLFDSGTTWSDQYQGWMPYFGVSSLDFSGYSSVLQGCVVDMIHLEFYWPSWAPFGLAKSEVFPPVFNVADFSISTGVCFIIIFYKKIVRDEDFKIFSS